MDKTRKNLLSATLVAVLLVGCSSSVNQRIEFDGTAHGLRKAVAEIAADMPEKKRGAVTQALETYLSNIDGAGTSQAVVAAAPLASLSGIKLSDFIALADRLAEPALKDAAVQHPTWVNPRLVEVMKLELQALADNRDRLVSAGYFTLEQMPYTAPSFIPPPSTNVRVDSNKAIFAFRMSNNTGLTIYRPAFNVRITVPGEELPVYSGRLVWDDPVGIPDGISRLVDLSCCSIVKEPYLNKRLRQLDERADIKIELVGVEDYRKRNPLRMMGFTQRDLARQRDLEGCIKDIELRMDRWTPAVASKACRQVGASSLDGSTQLMTALEVVGGRLR